MSDDKSAFPIALVARNMPLRSRTVKSIVRDGSFPSGSGKLIPCKALASLTAKPYLHFSGRKA